MSISATDVNQAMLPSTQRPIPLHAREDLVVQVVEYLGVGYHVVKDPVGLQYHRLQPEQYRVLRLLNGKRNLDEIREELLKEFPTLGLNLADIQHLITDLHEKGLVLSNRMGQAVPLIKARKKKQKQKLSKLFRNLLYLRLPGWDPETTLQWMYPYVRWLYQPWAVMMAAILVLSAWTLLMVKFEHFHSNLPEFQQFFGWPNLMYLWISLAIAKIIHEFGHGLSCTHFGGECHEMGVLLLVFSPCLYCDVTDSWMLKNKWHRIIIAAAGMYIEVIISALAIFVWWNTTDGMLHHLALNLFFVTTITTVIFNANPLLRFDGYYMMSDWLEIPNLRPKADKLLRESFAWYCLGIESRPDPFMPETHRGWFVAYAVAAWLYRWVILLSISVFLFTMLKPYGLQSIGVMLLFVSMGSIVYSAVTNMYRIIAAPRIEPMSKPKIAITLTVVAGSIVSALMLPLPLHIESAFFIEPHKVQHVLTHTPGKLTELKVQPGQVVPEGALLAQLSNPEREDRLRELEIQLAIQEIEIEKFLKLDDHGQRHLAEERKRGIEEQLADYRRQIERLTIRAPAAGKIVAPARKAEPNREQKQQQLSRWFGTPLDPKNEGCFLDEREHLLSIAPSPKLQAIVMVDQSSRNDMRIGQHVQLKFEHLPDRIYEGKIEDISKRQLDYAPQQLSNKLGGELATVTDSKGERLQSSVYQATVLLDQESGDLQPAMRGMARFLVEERTAAEWAWRYIRRTFHFTL